MTRRIFLVLVILSLFSIINSSYCQVGNGTNEESAVQHARGLYAARFPEQSGIYKGTDYVGYPHPVKKGQPFFLSTEMRKGEVRYDGVLYKDVPLWYDLVRKEVLVQHLDNYSRIILHNEKISDFSMADHHFIRIAGETAARFNLDEGFYDQIYKGKSEILVKRSKDFLISTDSEGVWMTFFAQKNDIFMRVADKYQPVSSQKSVLSAFGKHQKEILAHLRQHKIKFRQAREKAIVMMAAYFDQLNTEL